MHPSTCMRGTVRRALILSPQLPVRSLVVGRDEKLTDRQHDFSPPIGHDVHVDVSSRARAGVPEDLLRPSFGATPALDKTAQRVTQVMRMTVWQASPLERT